METGVHDNIVRLFDVYSEPGHYGMVRRPPPSCVDVRDGSSTSSLYHIIELTLYCISFSMIVTLVLRRGTYL
jgi:hypothetical protein